MSFVRKLVSKKKKRFTEDGFDLDLAYITKRIVAMGFPSTGTESFYRNPLEQVKAFFKKYHGEKYLVINLCKEKKYQYDKSRFDGRVLQFPFVDHNPPPLRKIFPFLEEVDEWLNKDEENIIAVHCKAGKGRTGTIIACYLLHTGQCKTAEEALDKYGAARTKNKKGVTIPSQRRYIKYYEECLKTGFPVKDAIIKLKKMIIYTTPKFDVDGGCDPYLIVENMEGHTIFDSRNIAKPIHYLNSPIITLEHVYAILEGDVKFTLWDYDLLSADDKMCSFWINTNMIDQKNPVLKLTKNEIDKAVKDKSCKNFKEDFAVELHFEICTTGEKQIMKPKAPAKVGEVLECDEYSSD